MQVLDYSAGVPSAAAVKAAGYGGAVRYLSWRPNGKVVSSTEAQDFWAHGLSIAFVWEAGANPLSGDAQAVGVEVKRQFEELGVPTSVPIYVAFDFDMDVSLWAAAAGFGDEVARASGHPWRGYMKKAAGEQLAADGHFAKYWCPYAWSGDGQPGPHACLFQRLQTVVVDGIDCDVNDVLDPDWGGFCPGGSTFNPVTPATVPAALAFGALMDSATFVHFVYDLFLCRDPDPQAHLNWTAYCNANGQFKTLAAILDSTEGQKRQAQRRALLDAQPVA